MANSTSATVSQVPSVPEAAPVVPEAAEPEPIADQVSADQPVKEDDPFDFAHLKYKPQTE
jgi:hypothetical protein